MISTDATIMTERESDQLFNSVRPYVAEIAAGVLSGRELSAAIDVANRNHGEIIRHFVIEGDLSTFGLRPHLLFPDDNRICRFAFTNRRDGRTLEISRLSDEEVHGIGNTLQLLCAATRIDDLLLTVPYPELIHSLMDMQMAKSEDSVTDWRIQPGISGIVRLQHASILIQTPDARVIVDPHFVSGYSAHLPAGSLMMPQGFSRVVDAVLITHSHSDHYHVPSLMAIPRDTLMIVPQVPEASILCPRIGDELRSLGFMNIVEPEWYSEPIQVGDIEIWTFPFHGEQPLRYEHPRDKRLRNWGNSYLFQTPEFSAWCLIDSGADAEGSMLEVAEDVKERFGKIDVVLSNLQEFYVGVGRGNPFYITGSGQYWLSLTADQIARFPRMSRDLLTLGPKGVAEICAVVKARSFLPYSHLWNEIGTLPPRETHMLQALAKELSIAGSSTQIASWRIGDTLRLGTNNRP